MIPRKDRQSTRCRERPQQRNGGGHHARDDRPEVTGPAHHSWAPPSVGWPPSMTAKVVHCNGYSLAEDPRISRDKLQCISTEGKHRDWKYAGAIQIRALSDEFR